MLDHVVFGRVEYLIAVAETSTNSSRSIGLPSHKVRIFHFRSRFLQRTLGARSCLRSSAFA
ncbi:MAG: hypothetical protein QOI53_3126 [Verrucomicrobiota bacterium]|nr:hypothetical protein [Verrucomicrobiota bacterium]